MDTPVPESAAIVNGVVAPVVGFPVHFRSRTNPEPQAALITKVWGLRMVNLVVFYDYGAVIPHTSVLLRQPGDVYPEASDYCEWIEVDEIGAEAVTPVEKASGLRLVGGCDTAGDPNLGLGTTISGSIHD